MYEFNTIQEALESITEFLAERLGTDGFTIIPTDYNSLDVYASDKDVARELRYLLHESCVSDRITGAGMYYWSHYEFGSYTVDVSISLW